MMIRYMAENEESLVKPEVIEWSPHLVSFSGSSPIDGATKVKKNEKFSYIRILANRDIVLTALASELVDLQYGFQLHGIKNIQAHSCSIYPWEPLMLSGVVVYATEPPVQNMKLLLHNTSARDIMIKHGDPIAVACIRPLPKKLTLQFVKRLSLDATLAGADAAVRELEN